jgi:arylsulfatase
MIDGIEMKDFFMGKTKKSGRESVIVYMGNDVYGIKWRNWKLHLKELAGDTWAGEVKEYGVPKLYNLYSDMQERENVFFSDAWVAKAAMPKLVEHAASLQKEPPIKPGTPDPYTPPRK